jgi:predicted DNA-binding ribbon-helix-helix protein
MSGKETEGVNTGLRLTKKQFDRLEEMAQLLNTSRNRVVGWLIEVAVIEQLPVLSAKLSKDDDHE